MKEKQIFGRLQQKHDTEENWKKAVNFVPRIGELIVYDPDETFPYVRMKIGDGNNTVSDLGFFLEEEIMEKMEEVFAAME